MSHNPTIVALSGLSWVLFCICLPLSAAVILDCRSIEPLHSDFNYMELSGITYVADEDVAYMVGDDGSLISVQLHFDGDKLLDMELLDSVSLLDAKGNPLAGSASDSEGVAAQYADDGVAGNTVLWVSFERDVRVCRYHVDGSLMDCPELLPPVADIANYRKPNAALESIAIMPGVGALVAAERPLKLDGSDDEGWHVIYAAASGAQYRVPARDREAGLTAIEIMPDKSLLLLERKYAWWRLAAQVELVRHQELDAASEPEVLLSASDDSLPYGNFEGIARRGQNYLFAVSDDNRMPLIPSLLLYIRLDVEGNNASCPNEGGERGGSPDS